MPSRISRIFLYFCITSFLFFQIPSLMAAPPAQSAAKKSTVKSAKKRKRSSRRAGKAVIAPLPQTTDIKAGIDQILSRSGNLSIGVLVKSADTGAILYERNATQNFTPASTLKLMTAATALTYLGPNYIFKTQFLTDAKESQNTILNGNLYIKFTGDPELTVADLDAMIAALERQGVHQVTGNLIIDDTDMDRENMAPGWLPDEQIVCYAAPSNAIIINRNCFGFNIVSGVKNGDPVQVKMDPNLANISVNSQAITNSARNACGLELKPSGNNTGTNAYLLTGCMRPRKTIGAGAALNDTRATGTSVVKYLLQQYCILVNGQILYTKTPNNLRVLVNHDSRPVSALVTRMLKKSDNLIAGSLFKKVGGIYFNTAGSWRNGVQAEHGILAPKTGIDFSKVNIFDGSGLSRLDAVSPEMFGKLLYYTFRMPFNDVFFQALPISGIDGTLKGRLGGVTLGKIHAKTGTMDGTSGLAGYIKTLNHQNLIFAILINNPAGPKGSQGNFHYIEDRICTFLALRAPNNVQPIQAPAAAKPSPVTNPAKK